MTRARDVSTPTALVLISSTTIGTAVSSVTVSNAFSAAYDAYRVLITGGTMSVSNNIGLKLGASTTQYYLSAVDLEYGGPSYSYRVNNGASWTLAARGDSTGISCDFNLVGVATATYTKFNSIYISTNSTFTPQGIHAVGTAYTDFTLTPASGTLTGGTIKVYGYK